MPGGQMVNRLQDLGYRVASVTQCDRLIDEVRKQHPMALVADLDSKNGDIPLVIQTLKEDLETQHIPILAFASVDNEELHEKARLAGAKLIAGQAAVLDQLPHLMEHLLEVD